MRKVNAIRLGAGLVLSLSCSLSHAMVCIDRSVVEELNTDITQRNQTAISTALVNKVDPSIKKNHGQKDVEDVIGKLVAEIFEDVPMSDIVQSQGAIVEIPAPENASPEERAKIEMANEAVKAAAAAQAEQAQNAQNRETMEKLYNGVVKACEQLVSGDSSQDATRAAVRAAGTSGGDSSYYLVLGTGNSLTPAGGFDTGSEATFRSTTNYEPLLFNKSGNRRARGSFELTFRNLDAPEETVNSTTDNSDTADNQGMDTGDMQNMDGGMTENNSSATPITTMSRAAELFAAERGRLRFDATYDPWYHSNDHIGFRTGIGFSSIPDQVDDVRVRSRYYFGPVFRADYGTADDDRNSVGEAFFGLAVDESWRFSRMVEVPDGTGGTTTEQQRFNEAERFVIDGRLDVPGFFQNDKVRLRSRFLADLPLSGRGPSEIRISLLLSVDIGTIFSLGN